jgi:uncharacterized protein (TIGR03435 family)
MKRSVILLAAFAVASSMVQMFGQAQSDQKLLAFEVASIKPVPFDRRTIIDLRLVPGRLVATGVTLANLIEQAHGIEPRQLTGGPTWVYANRFDVTATTGGQVTRERAMLMLQSLLENRFTLHMSRKTQTGTIYTLIARDVHALNPPAAPNERSRIAVMREDGNGTLSYHYDGHNATMAALARQLSSQLHAPVIDRTGLGGHYDFRINWAYDSAFGGLEPDPNVPTILTALDNQVGLKLESTKGPVDVLVIDHVEKPTPD